MIQGVAIANSTNQQALERELSRHQRNLVDTCFEEGNYDSGIFLLDKLRSPHCKPYPPHIRQLLYLALCPPKTKEDDTTKLSVDAPQTALRGLGTIKQNPSRRPTTANSVAAGRLLMAFAQTNTAPSLLRALPSYGLSDIPIFRDAHTYNDFGEEDDDSAISIQSKRLKKARNVWEILREGYVKPPNDAPNVQSIKGKRARHNTDDDETSDSEGSSTVGPHSFQILEWLITLFEKDEKTMKESGKLRFSPGLLAQLSSTHSASAPRWDMTGPIDVVFYCQSHSQPSAVLGCRLLTLLIHLAATIYVDTTAFLSTVSGHLGSLSPNQLVTFFTLLPFSPDSLRFQVALCKTFLQGGSQTVTTRSKPRPQARAAPRPVRAQTGSSKVDKPADPASSEQQNISHSPPNANKYPKVSATEIVPLLVDSSSPSDQTSTMRRYLFKFYLLFAFGELQRQTLEEEKDSSWQVLICSEKFIQDVESAFSSLDRKATPENQQMIQDLKNQILLILEGWSDEASCN